MSRTPTLNVEEQNPISTIEQQFNQDIKSHEDQINQIVINNSTTWTKRLKNYFITNEGRITSSNLIFTLICVVLQHVMGTCRHTIRDGTNEIQWHVFTPPFGAGPHTAVFFFVLSWITLGYCIQSIWVYLTTGVRVSKKRNLIVHGIIAVLYFVALGFNIWGYVLCESTSQVNAFKVFVPGVCRGDSHACIPLIAGVLTSCAAGCSFFAEHIFALRNALKRR